MKHLKGFVTISQYINNTPGVIAPLGELSTWSATYTKEKGEYQYSEVPGYKLISFKSVDDTLSEEVPIDPVLGKQTLEVVRASVAYAVANIRPYDSLDFRNTLLAEFFDRISDLNFGNFVDNGTIALPEWISWSSLETGGDTVKVWTSDASFRDQYDEYSITVIPPLDILDDFFGTYHTVVPKLQERTLADLSDIIQITKNTHPETYLRILNFDFMNLLSPTLKYSTNWAVLVYGKNGDNIDAIKDAIVEYVIENSTHTREEWEAILPDLFKRTEFTILPRWDKMSIPNLTELAGLYSSILNPAECVDFAKANIDFYPVEHIEANSVIMPYDFKAISLVVITGSTNIEGKQSLVELFPDYIPVPTSSIDFSRMQLATREWSLFLQELLITAETATQFTTIPINMRRIVRSGKLFITGVYDNVNYLVAARSNGFYGY